MTNLLTNGDFTADWGEQSSHRAWVCKPGEVPQIAQIGNIFTPPGWDTWFRHEPNVWDQPEVRDARTEDRMYDGHKSVLFFTFYRKHWGGFLQQVPVVPGQRYRLTAYAHAWSNSQNGPHVDDPRWSEGPGYGAGYMSPPLAENVPPPAGPGTTDDWRNFAFNVGLDPNGGVNPFDASVRWGTGASIYNQYGQVPAVEVTATEPVMTVWLRSRTLWPFKHNDAYWGAASLELVESEPQPEPPCECRGKPRVQYERTVNVIPATATPEQAAAIFAEAWTRGRETVTGSYDDAGIGALDVRRARLYDIPLSEWGMYERWYAEHYPGVEVEFAGDNDEPNPSEPPDQGSDVLLWQCDPAWRSYVYGIKALGRTLCAWGCFVTCIAMARRLYGLNEAETPVTVDEALGEGGYISVSLPTWAAIKSKLGISIAAGTTLQAEAHIDAGRVCLARVSLGGGEHWVLVNKRDGERYWMLDPYKNVAAWVDEYYPDGVESWRLLTPVDAPEPPPPPPYTPPAGINLDGGLVTLHLQTFPTSAEAFIRDTHPRIVKGLAGQQDWLGVMRNDPNARFLWRHHGSQHESTSAATPALAAQMWIGYWIDSLKRECDRIEQQFPGLSWPYMLVESWNEIYACGDPRLPWFVEAECEFLRQLKAAEPRVAGVVFTAPVGNPLVSEYPLLVPLARAAVECRGWFGYHGYWHGTRTQQGMVVGAAGPSYDEHWRNLAGRWTEMDKVFVANGYRVRWFLGESGLVGNSAPDGAGYALNPGSGWRDNTHCIGGDWPRYLAEILEMRRRIREWNAAHQNRCDGFALFTTGADYMGWQHFQVQGPEMAGIAAAL